MKTILLFTTIILLFSCADPNEFNINLVNENVISANYTNGEYYILVIKDSVISKIIVEEWVYDNFTQILEYKRNLLQTELNKKTQELNELQQEEN